MRISLLLLLLLFAVVAVAGEMDAGAKLRNPQSTRRRCSFVHNPLCVLTTSEFPLVVAAAATKRGGRGEIDVVAEVTNSQSART